MTQSIVDCGLGQGGGVLFFSRDGTYDSGLTKQEWAVTHTDSIRVGPGTPKEALEKGAVCCAGIPHGRMGAQRASQRTVAAELRGGGKGPVS